MKKLFAFALLAAFVLVGCEKEKGAGCKEHDADYNYPYLAGIYYSNHYSTSEEAYNYVLMLSTAPDAYDLATGETLVSPNVQYLFLDLYSNVPAPNYSVSFDVPEGVYTFDPNSTTAVGTVGAEYTYLFTVGATTNEKDVKITYFVGGEVVVADGAIDAKLTDEAGRVHHFVCGAAAVDNTHSFAVGAAPGIYTSLVNDLNLAYTQPDIYAINWGDYFIINKNYWTLYFDDLATGDDVVLEIIADKSKGFPVGVYETSNDLSRDEMVVPGYADQYSEAMFSWYLKWRGDDVVSAAPLVRGSVTIVDNGDESYTATLSFTDDIGNAITGVCTAVPYIEMQGMYSTLSSLSTAHRLMHPIKMKGERKVKPTLAR